LNRYKLISPGFSEFAFKRVNVYYYTTGKGLKDRTLRVAVVSGINNAKALIRDMRDGKRSYDFIEVMACPGGCIGVGRCTLNQVDP
jgi:iron only hydrogenase large subunit-like protein